MGRVFSYQEIQQGSVPEDISFLKVTNEIKEELAESRRIIGGIICGSTIRGDSTIRSDIDVVIVYRPRYQEKIFDDFRRMIAGARELYVPLRFIPIDSEIGRSDMHSITQGFYNHLEICMELGGIIGEKIIPFYLYGNHLNDYRGDVKAYLRRKLDKISKGYLEIDGMDQQTRLHYLQKVLEAPIHIARKMIGLSDNTSADSKNDVFSEYRKKFEPCYWEMLYQLLVIDNDYTNLIGQQLETPDEEAYEIYLKKIEQVAVPLLIEFLKLNSLLISNRYVSFTAGTR